MKALIGFTTLMIAICYFGDLTPGSTDHQTLDTQRPSTLFSIETPEHSTAELWESSLYQADGIETQVRWQKQGNHITVAKSCHLNGIHVVAQVTYNPQASRQTSLTNRVLIQGNRFCQIELEPTAQNNDFQILDTNIVFSETLNPTGVELQILADDAPVKTVLFQKI